jgi:nitric oxide reductase NorD protein
MIRTSSRLCTTWWRRRSDVGEPEEVIIEAVHLATVTARALWASQRGPDCRLRLTDVHRRLELLVATLFPNAPAIVVAETPPPLPFLARLASPLAARARPVLALPSTDGVRLRLPAVMDGPGGEAAIARYRLFALEQAARAERGTAAALPASDLLARDLFLIVEAAEVDRMLAILLPGILIDIVAARAGALADRSRIASSRLSRREVAVERLITLLLHADPGLPPTEIPTFATPAESRRWAEEMALRIRNLSGRYRGVAPVAFWGTASPVPDVAPIAATRHDAPGAQRPPRTHTMRRRPRARAASGDEDDAPTGTWIVRADDPQESVEDPMGLQRPRDQSEDADPGDLGDSLSDLREARLVRTPEAPREVLASDIPVPRTPTSSDLEWRRSVIVYPEWDYREGRYHTPGAVVREVPIRTGDSAWAHDALERHAALVRRVRRDFERLRPRREILRGQLDGSDVDVDAYVTATADACAGASPDARLYLADRHLRRGAAIFLLVDVSASTDSWVAGAHRVIDVEREAVLIVGEALAALGDAHAIFAFRGEGAGRVELLPLKRFTDSSGSNVRNRIAALEPDGFTRAGAAIRHATALLSREPATQRILLLLSDGRPNDVDIYEGRYGIEDTRRAFGEARLQGIQSFCLTVDRAAPDYAARVFGRGGFAVLQHPERLPEVLVRVLQQALQ